MNRISAVMSVVETLKREIPTRYQPGDILPTERQMAERFDVSRNTMREAIIFLEAYGFVEKTQRGARVTTSGITPLFQSIDNCFDRSFKTCRDLLEFRRFIETGVLPVVVREIADSELDELDRHIERMDRALTVGDAAAADFDFHYTLVSAAGNTVVGTMYKVMARTLTYYMEIGKSDPSLGQATSAHHRSIVAALRERSYPKALAASAAHFQHSEAVLNKKVVEP